PSRPAIFSCSALMLGSSAKTSSPSGAAIMAARIAAVGWVTVSLRRSTTFDAEALMALLQEVGEHGVAVLGEDGLGMELHALDAHRVREAGVAHAHDLAVVGPGGERQGLRAGLALDRQRVVAVDLEALGQAGEDAFAGGVDLAGLAVHQLPGPHDAPAEGRA